MVSSGAWAAVAPGVFQRRYDPLDVSVVAIVGPTGVTIVDTRNNPAEGAAVLSDAAREFAVPVVAAVNTHAHYDHIFGNQVFVEAGIPVFGHARIPAHFARFEGPRLARVQAVPSLEPDKAWGDVVLTPPTVLVDALAPTSLVLGGRALELVPLTPGHTDTDLAVRIPAVSYDGGAGGEAAVRARELDGSGGGGHGQAAGPDVWLLGDVIEESGAPMFGSGSFPLTWGASLDALLARIAPADVLVPGHGTPVTREFAAHQAALLAEVATFIRTTHASADRAGAAVPASSAPTAAPVHATAVAELADSVALPATLTALWPEWMLRSALREGLTHLANQR